MTTKLYYEDGYTTKFEATVLDCKKEGNGYSILLDQTFFYPEGGGQPSDIGALGGTKVLHVSEKGENIWHDTEKALEIGTKVTGEVDWENRFDLMQNHTAEHILSGIICKKYNCDNVGFHMGKEKITIDFNAKIAEEDIFQLEMEANEAVWKNVAIATEYPTSSALAQMQYRSKKELDGQVRIVRADVYDCCACCGVHVRLAGEIGLIKITSIQSYKGGTRFEMVAGKRALQHYQQKNQSADEAGRMLSVSGEKIGDAVRNLLAEKEVLLAERNQYKWEYFQKVVAQLPSGEENIFMIAESLQGKDVMKLADLIAEKTNCRGAVLVPMAEGYAYALVSRKADARTFADEMKQELLAKGGGKNDAIQGSVQGEEIVSYLIRKGFYKAELA